MGKHLIGIFGAIETSVGGVLMFFPTPPKMVAFAVILLGLLQIAYETWPLLTGAKVNGTPLRWAIWPGLQLRDAGLGLSVRSPEDVRVFRFAATITNWLREPVTDVTGVVGLSASGEQFALKVHYKGEEVGPHPMVVPPGESFTVDHHLYPSDPWPGGTDWTKFAEEGNDAVFKLSVNGQAHRFMLTREQMEKQVERAMN